MRDKEVLSSSSSSTSVQRIRKRRSKVCHTRTFGQTKDDCDVMKQEFRKTRGQGG